MSKSRPQLAAPIPNVLSEGMWKAAAEGRLVAQHCTSCGAHRYPPQPACYRCQSLEWDWDELPGTGTVFTCSWSHHPAHPGMAPLGVYNFAVIELDGVEGDPLRFTSWVTDVTQETLKVGLRVTVHFDPVDDDVALPIFKPL